MAHAFLRRPSGGGAWGPSRRSTAVDVVWRLTKRFFAGRRRAGGGLGIARSAHRAATAPYAPCAPRRHRICDTATRSFWAAATRASRGFCIQGSEMKVAAPRGPWWLQRGRRRDTVACVLTVSWACVSLQALSPSQRSALSPFRTCHRRLHPCSDVWHRPEAKLRVRHRARPRCL